MRSLLQPQLKGLGDLEPVELTTGGEADLEDVARRLTDMAYARVDLVTKRGEFAVRGGILDVFPPTDEHPSRVEFWGDEVEEIRTFAVADQRTIDKVERLWAPPCRELLLTPEVRGRAAELSAEHPELAEILDKLAEGIPVEGMESLAPALLDGTDSHGAAARLHAGRHPRAALRPGADPHPGARPGPHLATSSCRRAGPRPRSAARRRSTSAPPRSGPWPRSARTPPPCASHGGRCPRSAWPRRSRTGGRTQPWLEEPPVEVAPGRRATPIALSAQPVPLYHGDTARLVDDLKRWAGDGWAVALVFEGHGTAQRAAEVLRDAGLGVTPVDAIDRGHRAGPAAGHLRRAQPRLRRRGRAARGDHRQRHHRRARRVHQGHAQDAAPAAQHHRPAGAASPATTWCTSSTASAGTSSWCSARSTAPTASTWSSSTRPSKRGQPGDRLFVPTDQLDQLSRYVGGESPTLHKMGGSDWQKTKARARKAVREIAAQLIQLYAARQASKGHAFGPDTPWQRELEDAFPYTETPDQLAAIDEVKHDMEQAVPMDRLICGDVGYGKTEIAVRAAFKAVQDGKQVAVLVPTTLLAQQHFNTFTERMSQFPVEIRQLSRFQTPKEAALTLEQAADGTADIVIGTHRLLARRRPGSRTSA